MITTNSVLRSAPPIIAMLLCGCVTTETVRVDANTQDTTAASALWLQAEIAGMPLQNVHLADANNTDISVEIADANAQVRLTAVGTDNDSGVRRIEVAGFVTTYTLRGNSWVRGLDLHEDNFGSRVQTPLTTPRDVPKTARTSVTIDLATLTQRYQRVVINLKAVAESGAPPISNQPAGTRTMTLIYKQAGSPPP
jgi:hypothetical protein